MANGRHARGAEHPTAHIDGGSPAPEAPVLDASAPIAERAPSGRRRRVIEEAPAAELVRQAEESAPGTGRRRRAAAPAETPAETPAATPATGRRRKVVEDALAEAAEPALPAPTGRRRRAVETVETVAEATPAPAIGTGRRRAAGPVVEAPVTEAPVIETPVIKAPVIETPVVDPVVAPAPVVEVVETAPEAPVTELAPRSHRRAAAEKHGHAGSRRKVVALPISTPSGTALIAGAATVAIAAAGAIGAATSGSNLSTTNASVSGASMLGQAPGAGLVDSASVNREQARASRDLAREALADRAQAAAAAQKKQEAAARALAAAKARAQQLALIAQNYRLPVSGYHLTAGFGERSYHWSSVHTGLDFACAYGTVIHAVAAGQIIFAGWDGSYGWKTVIRHADGSETWYAHQSSILVRKGFVTAGEAIGRVGMTGNTTGPHLHLEVRINNVPVDPLTWLRAHGLRP